MTRGISGALRARGTYFVSKIIHIGEGIVLFPEGNRLYDIVSIARKCMDSTHIIRKPVVLEGIDIFPCHCNSHQPTSSIPKMLPETYGVYHNLCNYINTRVPHIVTRRRALTTQISIIRRQL